MWRRRAETTHTHTTQLAPSISSARRKPGGVYVSHGDSEVNVRRAALRPVLGTCGGGCSTRGPSGGGWAPNPQKWTAKRWSDSASCKIVLDGHRCRWHCLDALTPNFRTRAGRALLGPAGCRTCQTALPHHWGGARNPIPDPRPYDPPLSTISPR